MNYLAAQRYAAALNQAITDPTQIDPAIAALNALIEGIGANADLNRCLANPAIDLVDRAKVLDAVLDAEQAPQAVRRLLQTLLLRGRLGLADAVLEVFENLADDRLSRISATVTTAFQYSPANIERVQKGLEAYSGRSVQLKLRINPKLIGGVRAKIGTVVIDGSIRARLERIKNTMIAEELPFDEITGD